MAKYAAASTARNAFLNAIRDRFAGVTGVRPHTRPIIYLPRARYAYGPRTVFAPYPLYVARAAAAHVRFRVTQHRLRHEKKKTVARISS